MKKVYVKFCFLHKSRSAFVQKAKFHIHLFHIYLPTKKQMLFPAFAFSLQGSRKLRQHIFPIKTPLFHHFSLMGQRRFRERKVKIQTTLGFLEIMVTLLEMVL